MKPILLASLLLLFASPVFANGQNDFIFSKTVLRIIPKPSEPIAIPADSAKDKDTDAVKKKEDPLNNLMPVLERSPKEFQVEIRQQSYLDQRDFIVHQPFADKEGMLVLVDPPQERELKSTRMIAKADVLFVDADGIIFKIAPELNLGSLDEPIPSGKPMHAFVYLRQGTAAGSDIQIGDRIENTAFKTHPVVIQ